MKYKKNLIIQIILVLIPFVNLYAWYRIEKLGRDILVNVGTYLFGLVFAVIVSLGIEIVNNALASILGGILIIIISFLPPVYFIIRWTKAYNKKIEVDVDWK